ncbi:YihY family inner membrane protein [Halioxenophilus sp. WMMB6]|uniref:YihY family inner membrane protein n=1 Tax=Halioxenophilus sp. WMMB6 TaxID=3073815 RepID=UPI00295E48AC|nr:YihY family inner membrane protein [Halioxenophilus sp. WMMB6]
MVTNKFYLWITQVARYSFKLLLEIYRHFTSSNCQQSAAALTYVSLFALVPVLTLVYSMLSLLPASSTSQGLEAQLQGLIFDNLVPATGQAVQSYLAEFTARARKLTLPGVAMLVVTAYLMLKTIERTFNNIWEVENNRSGVSNFLIYWAILTLGPLLLGAGLVISTYVLSLELMVGEDGAVNLAPALFNYLPMLLSALAFTLFFLLVPNCPVLLRDAVVGGVLTAMLFELAKGTFADLVAKSSYQLIYGAFAIVPLFLLWIYVLWVLVLGGAVLVRTLAHLRIEARSLNYSDLIAALVFIAAVVKGMDAGRSVRGVDVFKLGVHSQQFNRISAKLLKAGVVMETRSGRFVLGRTLESLTLIQLAKLLHSSAYQLSHFQAEAGQPWQQKLKERLAQCDHLQQEALDIDLHVLLKE